LDSAVARLEAATVRNDKVACDASLQDQAGAQYSQSPIAAGYGAVIR